MSAWHPPARVQPYGLAGEEGESFVRAARSVRCSLASACSEPDVRKLANAEKRYRALLENARDAIGVTTPEGIILEANRGWERVMGVTRAQMSDEASRLHPGGRRSDTCPNTRRRSRRRWVGPPTALRRPDGTVSHVELSRTVVDVGGERYVLSVAGT